MFSDDSQGDSSRQVLVTLADPDPEAGTPERIDVACRGAQWETWSRPLPIEYTDHDQGSAPSRYMGADRTYTADPLTVESVVAQVNAILAAAAEAGLNMDLIEVQVTFP